MSRWCNTCHHSEYPSCNDNCIVFGKDFEELAETVFKQREEIDVLRWTNKQFIKAEKEKRRELWSKAENELVDKIANFFERKENWRALKDCWIENGMSNDLRNLLNKAIKE